MLTEDDLAAIRTRNERREQGQIFQYATAAVADVHALLADRNSLTAQLVTLASEVDGLRLLVHDLLHPAGDGSEEAVRCYEAGVRRCVALLRAKADQHRAEARTELSRRHALLLQALTLDHAATALIEKESAS